MSKRFAAVLLGVVGFGVTLTLAQTGRAPAPASVAPEFVADWTFRGNALPTGWQPVGDATWRVDNGEIVGTPSGGGGWLMSNQGYQDVAFFSRVRCEGACETGLLLRAEKTPTGYSGIFVSLKDGDFTSYKVTLDATGKFATRDAITNITWGTIRTGQPPAPPNADAGRGGRAGGGGGGGGGGGARNAGPGDFRNGLNLPTPLAALEPPVYGLGKQPGGWDQFSVLYDSNIVRPYLNNTNQMAPSITEESMAYGPIALYVSGTGAVRFKDVALRDLAVRKINPEQVSSRFRMQRLEEFYYGWGAAAADFNRDGNLDVVSGPYYYLGPDFTTRREIRLQDTVSPGRAYPADMVTHAFDFTGDGWPDVLATESRPMVLYVNPGNQNRRWVRHAVLPQVSSETTILKDLNGDNRPEVVYAFQNTMYYATYDPANATAPWTAHKVSSQGVGYAHGVGVGDVNGDGRQDILSASGWFEQPASLAGDALWQYHPVAFGRWGRSQTAGGGEIHVYDVNGDRLPDVVAGLHGHGWGLAWFEQKRDAAGAISFVEHMIMDNYSTANAGNVTFAEIHGLSTGDVDGDGTPDIITGKRAYSHNDSYFDPDAQGEAVLYWYRTVRNPRAPGGAEFVPELIHNRSGVGSQIAATDLNKDGALDVVTATSRGLHLFFGMRRR